MEILLQSHVDTFFKKASFVLNQSLVSASLQRHETLSTKAEIKQILSGSLVSVAA